MEHKVGPDMSPALKHKARLTHTKRRGAAREREKYRNWWIGTGGQSDHDNSTQ